MTVKVSLQSIMDAASTGIMSIDADGVIQYCNAQASIILDFNVAGTVGEHISTSYPKWRFRWGPAWKPEKPGSANIFGPAAKNSSWMFHPCCQGIQSRGLSVVSRT